MKIHHFAFLGIRFELRNGGYGGCRALGTVRWVRYGYGTGTVRARYCGRGKNGNPSVPTRAGLSEAMFVIALEIVKQKNQSWQN